MNLVAGQRQVVVPNAELDLMSTSWVVNLT